MILAANMYAKASEFVDGSGDDNDVFAYFTDGHVNINYIDSVNAIAGDVIEDLDIGQNSLSLRAEEGEGFGLMQEPLDQNSVVIDLSYSREQLRYD